MFSENRGDRVLPVDLVQQAVSEDSLPIPQGGVGVGTCGPRRSSRTSR